MTGTLGGALEARGIPAGENYLSSDTIGEIERDNNVLVIKRIHITYNLTIDAQLAEEKAAAIQRAMSIHPAACPVHKSIGSSIQITTELNSILKNPANPCE